MSPQNDTNEVITKALQEFTSDHEEADTILYAKHVLPAFPSIIIKTLDTDVFLIFALLNSMN